MHTDFQIDQGIAIVVGPAYFDLHNNFDFVGYEYQPTEQTVWLKWKRGSGGWIPDGLPVGLALAFQGVTNFSAHRRDDAEPFTEDDCLADITFLPPEMSDNFDCVCPDYRSENEHLLFKFESGAGIKIWAARAALEFLNG